MTNTRKSVVYSALANFGSIATSLVLVVVVARWLFPEEVGAFAVAYAVIALLEPLRQAQIVAYVIQAKDYDHSSVAGVSYVGWVATAIMLLVCVIVALVMITVAGFEEPGMLVLIMSGGFIASTLAQPAFAALNREMQFGVVSAVELMAAIVKTIVTIACLYAGWRAEALAFGVLAEFVFKLVYIFKVRSGLAFAWPSRKNTGSIWDFCLKLTGAQFVNRSAGALDALLIGGFLGLAGAGFYNRSSVLVRTMRSGIEKAILPVALAVFSASNRKDQSLARRDYLHGVSLLTGVSWSALAVFIVVAEPLIMTAYGERWVVTIPLAQVLAAGAILHAATAMVPSLMASLGRVDVLFRRNLLIQIPRLLILFVSVQFNLTVVVWGAFAAMVLNLVVNQSLLAREVEIGIAEVVSSMWRSAAVAGSSALSAYLVLHVPAVQVQSYPVQLAVSLATAGVIWLGVLFAVDHPLRAEFLRTIVQLRSWISRST